jgi:hypothetical protein
MVYQIGKPNIMKKKFNKKIYPPVFEYIPNN